MKNTCNSYPEKPINNKEGFLPSHEFPTHFRHTEAFVGVLVAAAVSGADMLNNERIDLFTYLKHSEDFQKTTETVVSHNMAQMLVYLEENGFDSLFDQVLGFYIQSYDSSLYEDACKVIYLIKNEDMEESQFLDELRIGLGLTEIDAWEIHAEIRGAGDFPLAA